MYRDGEGGYGERRRGERTAMGVEGGVNVWGGRRGERTGGGGGRVLTEMARGGAWTCGDGEEGGVKVRERRERRERGGVNVREVRGGVNIRGGARAGGGQGVRECGGRGRGVSWAYTRKSKTRA